MIIEPCCCHKQLPPLCKENIDRLTAFNTNGDVTIEKTLFAIACLVGKSTLTVITPTMTHNCLAYLKHGISREWFTKVRIMTAPHSSPLGEIEGVVWVKDKRITEGSSMLILEGQTHRLCITGYLPPDSPADTDNTYRSVNHTLLYTTVGESLIWDELTKIPTAPFRICLTKKTLIS